jgi:hypothetical protein
MISFKEHYNGLSDKQYNMKNRLYKLKKINIRYKGN